MEEREQVTCGQARIARMLAVPSVWRDGLACVVTRYRRERRLA